MTLNGVIAIILRYFNEFAKPAFQLITGSSSIKLIDQKSASVTYIAVKLVCVTKLGFSFKFHVARCSQPCGPVRRHVARLCV